MTRILTNTNALDNNVFYCIVFYFYVNINYKGHVGLVTFSYNVYFEASLIRYGDT